MRHRRTPLADMIRSEVPNFVYPEMMTLTEAAKYLRMHPKTLSASIREGDIPSFRVGRQYRFKKSVLDAWIEANMRRTGWHI